MRLPFFAMILALLPLPALADVTARYSAGKGVLLVESDDGGNARIGLEDKFGIIRRDGVDYALMTMPSGETKVAEFAELMALMSAAIAGDAKAGGTRGVVDKPFLLLAKGEVMVGDRKGSAWSFGPERETDGRPGEMKEFVMSADPVLAPVGAIFARTAETLLPLMSAIIPESTGFATKARELLAKGAPLRVDTLFELKSVTTAEIDPKRFELPSPVVPATEFLMAMNPGAGEGFNPLP